MNQSTKINLIGCDTIVNSPSLLYLFNIQCKINIIILIYCIYILSLPLCI